MVQTQPAPTSSRQGNSISRIIEPPLSQSIRTDHEQISVHGSTLHDCDDQLGLIILSESTHGKLSQLFRILILLVSTYTSANLMNLLAILIFNMVLKRKKIYGNWFWNLRKQNLCVKLDRLLRCRLMVIFWVYGHNMNKNYSGICLNFWFLFLPIASCCFFLLHYYYFYIIINHASFP